MLLIVLALLHTGFSSDSPATKTVVARCQTPDSPPFSCIASCPSGYRIISGACSANADRCDGDLSAGFLWMASQTTPGAREITATALCQTICDPPCAPNSQCRMRPESGLVPMCVCNDGYFLKTASECAPMCATGACDREGERCIVPGLCSCQSGTLLALTCRAPPPADPNLATINFAAAAAAVAALVPTVLVFILFVGVMCRCCPRHPKKTTLLDEIPD